MTDVLIYVISFGIVGLFVYILLRYGPVYHSWMGIPEELQKKIEHAHKEYVKTHKNVKKAKPKGKPLYKKRLVSHSGVAIYSNGIYGKFCIGAKGKYKFKRFEDISAIYPVEVENPFTNRDSLLLGFKGWKELQIETKDYEVLMIDSRVHDFEELVPILKRAMGPLWNKVYRESEVIKGNFLSGRTGWHSFIRNEKLPSNKNNYQKNNNV